MHTFQNILHWMINAFLGDVCQFAAKSWKNNILPYTSLQTNP